MASDSDVDSLAAQWEQTKVAEQKKDCFLEVCTIPPHHAANRNLLMSRGSERAQCTTSSIATIKRTGGQMRSSRHREVHVTLEIEGFTRRAIYTATSNRITLELRISRFVELLTGCQERKAFVLVLIDGDNTLVNSLLYLRQTFTLLTTIVSR